MDYVYLGKGAIDIKKKIVCPNGKVYPSITAMCEAYGISRKTYEYRIEKGATLEDALSTTHKFSSKNIVCPKGNKYPSKKAMCEAYGVPYATFESRIRRGVSLEEALIFTCWLGKRITCPKGNKYPSIKAMCEAYGISYVAFVSRIRGEGITLEDALNITNRFSGREIICPKGDMLSNTTELCRAYGVSYHVFRRRIKNGDDLETALGLTGKYDKSRVCPNGVEYPTIKAMCAAYGVSRRCYLDRVKRGWTQREALNIDERKNSRCRAKQITAPNGITYDSISEMCREYGVHIATLYGRLYRGMSLKDALGR